MAKRRDEPTEISLWDLPPGDDGPAGPPGGAGGEASVPLHEAAQARYLNYALSVITSRALPDVRDGLKPVQRRILYTMWQQNLTADAKHRKCAKVVGDVMGSYHPHGDAALYETLVRHGAALLAALSPRRRLRQLRVARRRHAPPPCATPSAGWRASATSCWRKSTRTRSRSGRTTTARSTEPVVLPARLPNLLVNGATGIAVGMATNIPPHNLGEVCTALLRLIDNPDLTPRAALPLHQGTRLPHRRPDPQLARRAEGDLPHRLGRGPPARHLAEGARHARGQTLLRHQHSLHGQQGDARRAHRRGRRSRASCRSWWTYATSRPTTSGSRSS